MKTTHKLVMAGAFGLAALSPVQAVVINSGYGAANALSLGADFSSVVRIFITKPDNSTGVCTGSLISEFTILTAKHCTSGLGASAFMVDFDQNGNGSFLDANDRRMNVSAKFEAPDPLTNANLKDGTDLAMLTLDGHAPGWASSFQLLSAVTVGSEVTMVGYGGQGVNLLQSGAGVSRWAAENIVDKVGAAGFNEPNSTNIISTDFDNGTALGNTLGGNPVNSSATPLQAEGTTAGGDSGGPLLFYLHDAWFIGGVLSGGSDDTSSFGDMSWWTGVGNYRAAIEAAGGEFLGPIPEPATWAMALMGLCAFGVLGRRRQLR